MLTSKVISEVEDSLSVIKLEDGNKEEKSRKNKILPRKIQKLAEFSQDSPFISQFKRHSHLLMALIEPDTLQLHYANDYFCRLIGIEPTFSGDVSSMEIKLFSLFLDLDQASREQLYRRHLLHLVFRDIYQIDLYYQRLLDEPVMASLSSPIYSEPRLIQFWLRCDQLQVSRVDPQLDEFADLNLGQMSLAETAKLINSIQIEELEQRLRLENYRIDGLIFLEGIDVTIQETIRRIEQRLIDRESIFRAEKFQELSQQMRSLFRANNSLILRAEGEQAQLSISGESHTLRPILSSMQSLQGSHFLRAAKANRVWNVSDLALDCQTDYERDLLERGIRSLLLIPIIARTTASGKFSRQLMGLLGLTSDRPHNFDQLDCKHAENLIPALTAALRQANHGRFTHIHSSVEWRFLEEAERRSWGLAAEQIIFKDVYPLYGISDIRGSSDERNRAIQEDLLEQFRLAIAVLDAVCKHQQNALTEQLRIDLLAYTEKLQENVTVDAEVTAINYLRNHLENYFDYFSQCNDHASAAVEAYRNACANENQCVYTARDRFDQLINQIRSDLRANWERHQVKMQQIIPHYCDLECTDGIDHMIYVGASIEHTFSPFHLHSLRYEQLRAVCESARTAFSFKELYKTELQLTHLILVQDTPVDIFHDEKTEKLFDVRGTSDTRYEIVKKRLDKGVDAETQTRITQPGMLTIVYSTEDEWEEYQQYVRYLVRDGLIDCQIEFGNVAPLQGVTGLKFARVRVLQ